MIFQEQSMKKISSIIAAAIIFSSSIYAASYSGGSGTEADPYLIATPANLNTLGATSGDWGKCFKLVANINMSAYTGIQYNIIGTSVSAPFTGTFDGDGYVIRNLSYSTPASTNYIGMFGCTSYATIKNLGVENSRFSTQGQYVGGLIGIQSYGTIINCHFNGSVVSTYCAGGLIGQQYYGIAENCYATGSIIAPSASYVGGLIGYQSFGTAINCHSTTSVTSRSYVGGLVGIQSESTITDCYSTGNVSASGYNSCVGGLIGEKNKGTVTGCYSVGSVSSTASSPYDSYAGGLIGHQYLGAVTECYSIGSVSSTASSSSSDSYAGGLIGYNDCGSIAECYSLGSISSTASSSYCYAGGLIGKLQSCSSNLIKNCYSIGTVTVTGSTTIGGFSGYYYGLGTLSGCFWDVTTSGMSNAFGSGSSGGVTGKITIDMQTPSTFTDAGWDFVGETINGTYDIWQMPDEGYPCFVLIAVPDIFGMTQSEAESAIISAGLGVGIVSTAYSNTVPNGYVMIQEPTANSMVAPSSTINIIISIGVEPISVPNVVGMLQADAETAIMSAGLTVGTVSTEYSSSVAAGYVISQDPTVGTSVTSGHLVSIVISLGTEPISVPDVVSMLQADAETAIESAGLVVGTISTAYSDTVAAGYVISQDPNAGILVAPGSSINIVISLGETSSNIITIGTGTSSWEYPLAYYYDARTQTIYLASEIGSAKTLSSLAIDVEAIPSQTMNNFTIRVKHTSLSEYYYDNIQWESTGWTTVYQADETISATGWTTFIFNTPFYYDGTQNLMVDISFNNSSWTVSGLCRYSEPGGLRSLCVCTDDSYGDPLTWSGSSSPWPNSMTYIPNIRLGYGESGSTTLTVPDVVGMTQTDAQNTIVSTGGLNVGISTAFSDTVAAGYVISQYPIAGTSASFGSLVNITVSLGSGISVPDVVGMTQTDAQTVITAAGLNISNISTVFSDTVAAGCVVSQDPMAGTLVVSGSLINLIVSLGPEPTYSGGSGTSDDPYLIATPEDINVIGTTLAHWSKCFKLVADINMVAYSGTRYKIIGTSYPGFTGTFDGNGHVIRNLTYNTTTLTEYVGLFGCVHSAAIKNLGLENVNIFTNSRNVGGLIGAQYYGVVLNCYSTGTVTSIASYESYAGGLVGYQSYGTAINCYSTGAVISDSNYYAYAGGLVGHKKGGTIEYCYSTGEVIGNQTGGLAGACYSYITEYVCGNICDEYGNCHEECWYVDTPVEDNSLIQFSFWDINTSGQAISAGGTGKTTVEMQTQSTFTDAGWDFVGETTNGTNDYWRMCVDGVDYPGLKWEYSSTGDFVCPDGVNFLDFVVLAEAWQSTSTGAEWNAICDISTPADNKIDALDLEIFAENWLE
jgi:beta-lactam-binding protein with PASTA domain